jgi:hypothetical protein
LDGAWDIFLDKITKWHFLSFSDAGIWPKKFKFHAGVKKCHFGNFSEHAAHHLKIPHTNLKDIFLLGANNSLERLAVRKTKLEGAHFF